MSNLAREPEHNPAESAACFRHFRKQWVRCNMSELRPGDFVLAIVSNSREGTVSKLSLTRVVKAEDDPRSECDGIVEMETVVNLLKLAGDKVSEIVGAS